MAGRSERTPEESKALDAYVKLLRASESVAAALSPELQAAGVTLSQFGCLEALYHLGPLCPREISRKLLRSPGNITTLLDNLERARLVRRVRDKKDRRFVTVHLTEAGRSLIADLFPLHAQSVAALFASLSASETVALAGLCKKLGLAAAASRPGRERPSP